jgi:hypothetical protein
MDTTTIQASLNTNNTHVITFTNPLDIATHFKVALKDTQSSEHFCLLMKRTCGILLQPGVSLDMPVMFAPETMHTHKTTITVSCSITEEKGESGGNQLSLEWQFPIVGVPEIRPVSPQSAPKIVCRAKERMEERLEVELVGCKMSRAARFCPATQNSTHMLTNCTLNPTSQQI